MVAQDTNLRPIQSVSISLIPKAYPSGGEKSRETKLSDGDGRVIFQEQHERCTEVLMIHGWEEYFWRLCIQKSGFQSQLADLKADALSNGKIVINLTAGQSISCESSWQ